MTYTKKNIAIIGQKGSITMDENKLREIAKTIYESMTDDQRAKAAECQTDEEFAAYMNSLEMELSDDAAEAVAGGIQAGDVMRHIRDEFIKPPRKSTIGYIGQRCEHVI